MFKAAVAVCMMFASLYASDARSPKAAALARKGEKIVQVLCDKEKLPVAEDEQIDSVEQKIAHSHACPHLDRQKREAVAYYLLYGSAKISMAHIDVPKEAKCPVCGMYVHKYPKWTTTMVHDGKTYYFDGVKDMMKYYLFDGDFPYDRHHIDKMLVSDYYTLEAIPAKKAFYVFDSTLYGPMGRELVPFKSRQSAENFSKDHHGKKIVTFSQITGQMLMQLDGLEPSKR